jgi:hypothetical protein
MEVQVMRVKSHWFVSTVGAAVLLTGCAHASASLAPAVPTTATGGTAAVQGTDDRSQVSLDAKLLADFQRRVDRYMRLHDKVQKQGTRQQQSDDIGENLVSQRAMATRLRLARHDARPGDLFTRPIARALRRAMDPELRGLAARGTRESIRDDAPMAFVLVVNASFPEGAPRSMMPANVLRILPSLPTGLEYRIVDTHLVLMDLDANIVVDYMVDVMCRTC